MTLFKSISPVMNGFFDFTQDSFGFLDSLKVMLLGLIIIFIVTGVLILCVAVLNKMGAKSKRSEKK